MSDKNNKSEQINELLQTVSKSLGVNSKDLEAAAKSGNLNSIIKGLNPNDAKKIQNALSDKNTTSKILSSPQAQSLLKKFLREK